MAAFIVTIVQHNSSPIAMLNAIAFESECHYEYSIVCMNKSFILLLPRGKVPLGVTVSISQIWYVKPKMPERPQLLHKQMH